jgi:hypothetical protein
MVGVLIATAGACKDAQPGVRMHPPAVAIAVFPPLPMGQFTGFLKTDRSRIQNLTFKRFFERNENDTNNDGKN